VPRDILSLLKSDLSGPSDARRAFLPAVVLLEVLALLLLAMGDEALERDWALALLAAEPFLVGSLAGG
jgi:hypothetical protein